jgi:penicillin-binding protein 1C
VSAGRAAALALVAGTFAFAWWLCAGPLPPGLLERARADSVVLLDRHGEILYEARGSDGERSIPLDADALPAPVVDATIAAEDRRFRRHFGLDPVALVRAAVRDLRHRRIVEGGSTISQQTAKLLLARAGGRRGRGLLAKLEEAVVALRLEHRLTKREILALYLNQAAYGNQLIGVERASRAYFGASARTLTPAQAAFLAALPQRPSTFNPYRDPVRARRRQEQVIVGMGLAGSLSPDGVREALDERLALVREPAVFLAPHFVARVLEARERTPAGGRPGTIVTTLDAGLQRTVEGVIRAERPVLARIGATSVAAVVLDNRTGEWLAWEGSGHYGDASHGGDIDGAIAPRQPGSALKPFTYALAFEQGETPASVLPDIPSYFATAQDGVVYAPKNYDNQFRGPLLARRALAGSENVPAVALASRVGVPNLLRFLRTAGLSTFDRTAAYYGLGLTLGDAEVRLDELVAAYAAFARGGVAVAPRMIRAGVNGVDGANGENATTEERSNGDSHLYKPDLRSSVPLWLHSSVPSVASVSVPSVASVSVRSATSVPVSSAATVSVPSVASVPSVHRLVSERTAFWITDILSDDNARAFAFGRGGNLDFPFPVAAKTGTSQAYRDNWVVGYTQAVTVGVWVGNFDRQPLVGSSGVSGAGPIFHAIMLAAARFDSGGLPPAAEPATVATPAGSVRRSICSLTGLEASPWCPGVIDEWIAAEAPPRLCTWHRPAAGGRMVEVRWPPEYVDWAARQHAIEKTTPVVGTRHAAAVRQAEPGPVDAVAAADIRIVSPPDGAVYLIDPTLRRAFQTLPLRASSDERSSIEWRVDDEKVAVGPSWDWPLAAGRHTVTALDAHGRRAVAHIIVK